MLEDNPFPVSYLNEILTLPDGILRNRQALRQAQGTKFYKKRAGEPFVTSPRVFQLFEKTIYPPAGHPA
jgi:hypothetical protein